VRIARLGHSRRDASRYQPVDRGGDQSRLRGPWADFDLRHVFQEKRKIGARCPIRQKEIQIVVRVRGDAPDRARRVVFWIRVFSPPHPAFGAFVMGAAKSSAANFLSVIGVRRVSPMPTAISGARIKASGQLGTMERRGAPVLPARGKPRRCPASQRTCSVF
jgi:hypothetical protein